MSDMTTAGIARLAPRRAENAAKTWDEPVVPARHVVGATLLLIGATLLALLLPTL